MALIIIPDSEKYSQINVIYMRLSTYQVLRLLHASLHLSGTASLTRVSPFIRYCVSYMRLSTYQVLRLLHASLHLSGTFCSLIILNLLYVHNLIFNLSLTICNAFY